MTEKKRMRQLTKQLIKHNQIHQNSTAWSPTLAKAKVKDSIKNKEMRLGHKQKGEIIFFCIYKSVIDLFTNVTITICAE